MLNIRPIPRAALVALVFPLFAGAQTAAPAFKWSELLTANLLLVYGMYFTMGYTLYFNLTWLPTYLKEVRGFTVQQAGYVAGLVLLAGALANWVGGTSRKCDHGA